MTTEKPIKIYSVELIFAIAVIGGIIVFAIFGNIWNEDGLISSWFSFSRFFAVFAAVLLGLAIGWMTFPRIPTDAIGPVLGEPGVDPEKTMTWARRREGIGPNGKLWPGAESGPAVDLSGTGRTMERDQTKPI